VTFDELRARATIERHGYRVFDGEYAQMSVTLEDAEFLYSLVRLIRPTGVLELGTGLGLSGRFIAEALVANGRGRLVTVEPDEKLAARAAGLLADLPVLQARGWRGVKPDLVFIDSRYDLRHGDIEDWLTNGYRGLILVHDSHRDYPELQRGAGVYLPGVDGLWLGRAA